MFCFVVVFLGGGCYLDFSILLQAYTVFLLCCLSFNVYSKMSFKFPWCLLIFCFVFWSRSAVKYEYMVVWCVTQTLNSTFQSLYFCPALLHIMVWCVVQIVDYHVFFIVIFLSGPHTVQFYNMMAQSAAHTVISHFQSVLLSRSPKISEVV